jgi:hypothetical protein
MTSATPLIELGALLEDHYHLLQGQILIFDFIKVNNYGSFKMDVT